MDKKTRIKVFFYFCQGVESANVSDRIKYETIKQEIEEIEAMKDE